MHYHSLPHIWLFDEGMQPNLRECEYFQKQSVLSNCISIFGNSSLVPLCRLIPLCACDGMLCWVLPSFCLFFPLFPPHENHRLMAERERLSSPSRIHQGQGFLRLCVGIFRCFMLSLAWQSLQPDFNFLYSKLKDK